MNTNFSGFWFDPFSLSFAKYYVLKFVSFTRYSKVREGVTNRNLQYTRTTTSLLFINTVNQCVKNAI